MTTIGQSTKSEAERIPIAEMSGVYKIFKQKKIEVMALRGIDLKIYPGELIVIMGPSGSGKTTLLNCLCGIERPNAGSVKIKGMEITKLRDEGIQKLLQEEIGIVFQSFNLIQSLTAGGNVELPMVVLGKLSKSERRTRVGELLKKVGLENRQHHRPSTLSGGEKQRLSIAMAFANDPSIVIADEPTANVDSVSAENIMRVFQEFMASNPNKALLIVTHDPALRKIADYTLVIRDGQFVRRIEKTTSLSSESEYENALMGTSNVTDLSKSRSSPLISNIIQKANFPYFNDISLCPNCHSTNIVKKLDFQNSFCQILENKLLQRAALFCRECNELSFITVISGDLDKLKIKREMIK
ncbi:MAG: ABC transporter ATP-binding protein [Candidatus Lokiarchaeota archaeon]|nr:ABC transporter ATP-binding protein [Candidatus Harpocratesius repetitus]